MSIFSIWDNAFLKYGKEVAAWCNNHEFGIIHIATMPSIRSSLAMTYQVMVKKKLCVPIEQIDPKEKLEMWREAGQYGLNKSQAIEFCKAVWALGNLL